MLLVVGYWGLLILVVYGVIKVGLINMVEFFKFDFDWVGICI